ncbi:MAG: hypothetical protein AB1403_23545 [Candidatus Riflebacteria bacterium]
MKSLTARIFPAFFLFALWGTVLSHAAELKADFCRGRVYYKQSVGQPFELNQGKIGLDRDISILTFVDGQCFISNGDACEFRLKEDSLLFFQDTGHCEVRKGLVGIRAPGGSSIQIRTPHSFFQLEKGTVVIKVFSVLTRICVVQGSILLKNPDCDQQAEISAGQEIAAGNGMYSRRYQYTDELRYTWYWVDAVKEPGLRLE